MPQVAVITLDERGGRPRTEILPNALMKPVTILVTGGVGTESGNGVGAASGIMILRHAGMEGEERTGR